MHAQNTPNYSAHSNLASFHYNSYSKYEVTCITIIGVNVTVMIVVLMALAPLRPVGGAESQLRLLLFLFENFLFNQRL